MILLTGSTGFTGQYVLDLLLEKGYEVTCFVRKSSNIDKLKGKNIKIAYGDLGDYESLLAALKGADTLINIASLGFGHAPNIVKACRESGVKRAIFISTTAIFTSLNAESKKIRLEAESLIKASDLDYTILRPTMIYGTHEDRNMCRLISFLSKFPVIPVMGNGKCLQQPVYVKDVAQAVLLALENPVSIKKEYNIAGAKELAYNEVIDITAGFLNKKVIKIHIPLSLCLLFFSVYEKLSSKPKLKKEQALRLNENKNFSIEKAKAELGYSALSFEEGISLEIEEMRKANFVSKPQERFNPFSR